MKTLLNVTIDDKTLWMVIIVAGIITLTFFLAELLKFNINKRKSEKELVMSLVEVLISEKKNKITITGLKKHSSNIEVEFKKDQIK